MENMTNGVKRTIKNVRTYTYNKELNSLILQAKKSEDSTDTYQLYDLKTGATKVMFKGENASDFLLDDCRENLAFTVSVNDRKKIAIYNLKKSELRFLPYEFPLAGGKNLSTETWKFSADCKNIIFALTQNKDTIDDNPNLHIWNYQDAYLYPEYKTGADHNTYTLAKVELNNGNIVPLISGNFTFSPLYEADDIYLATSSFGRSYDVPWNSRLYFNYYLVNARSGKIDTIKDQCASPLEEICLSPDHKMLVYYDGQSLSYYSYNLINKQTINISNNIPESIFSFVQEHRGPQTTFLAGTAGWCTDTKNVIIKTRHNLYSVDPTGKTQPINITAHCSSDTTALFLLQSSHLDFNSKRDILLSSFSFGDKSTTFYKTNLSARKCVQIFKTFDYITDPLSYPFDKFHKAKNADKYLFNTDHATRSRNYFFTDNFKTFDTLSYINPQDRYQWLTTEIIKYKDSDGEDCEAILYKPENFDPSRKYPVIINYYLSQTHWLNKRVLTVPENTGFNVPLLLSNGYIVVRPNIYISRSQPGESALKSVLAVADYLSSHPWADSRNFGIMGHSWAGYLTNYIVTHSTRFKAAVSAAGVTDLLSSAAGIWGNGGAAIWYYKLGPFRLMKELNEAPELYVANSPIASTGNVNTPLLLVHNDEDNLVPVTESKQFFTQLRRQGKPVWMLQYEHEMHAIAKEENALDLQRKILGYFDYWLKGRSIPAWMTKHN
ncbi:MAG: prolyl oligopeptidase family serine peptidase [Bacteroidota bacterium]